MDIFPNVSKASSKTAGFRHGCLAGMWNNPKLYEIFFVSYHTFGFLRSSPRGTLLGCVATVGSHDPTFIDNLAAAISTFQLNKFGQLHALSLHSCWEPLKWIKNETSSMWNGLSRQWLCRLECKSTNQKQPCRSEPITIPSSKCGMPKFISGLINQTNLYHVYYVKMVAPEGKYSCPPPSKNQKKPSTNLQLVEFASCSDHLAELDISMIFHWSCKFHVVSPFGWFPYMPVSLLPKRWFGTMVK